MCKNFHFWWIILFAAVRCSTSGSWGDLIRYESLPPLHWILNRGLPQPSLGPQGLPMLPHPSDSLAPPELRALTTYVTVTSIVSQCRLPLQETLDSFQTAKSGTKHVSWWICLAPKKKKPNFLQISSGRGLRVSGAIAVVQKAQSKSAREVGGPTTGRGGMQVWKKWPVADLSRKNLFNHWCDANLRTETWPDSTCRQKWQIAARGNASVKHAPKGHK